LTIQNGYNLTTAADFSNAGNLAASSGSTFTVTGGYTQTGGGTTLSGGALAASGLVDIQAGVLGGAGSAAADVRHNGLVNPGGPGTAGLLSVTGAYTQTANGVLNLKVGGPNPGTDFDQLSISGPAALGGTLNVPLLYFVPASGATFQIVTFASRGSS